MKRRVPPGVGEKCKICIICEGEEEYEYLQRLKDLCVWKVSKYVVTLVNAGGNAKILDKYKYACRCRKDYDIVLILCDTEDPPHKDYNKLKSDVTAFNKNFDEKRKNLTADKVIIFSNPCTMQVIIKHWTDKKIEKSDKAKQAPLIKRFTGISDYKGNGKQLESIMQHIDDKNFKKMQTRVKALGKVDTQLGSSNFIGLLECLQSDDSSWIKNGIDV